MLLSNLKVALVHDWLTGMRGGEKVLEVFCHLFPDAPIYTMVHRPGSVSDTIAQHRIITSELQKLPKGISHYRYYLPLMPTLVDRVRIEPVDLVVSISTCVAKAFIPPAGARHAAYVNSPMRYMYDRFDDYFAPDRAGFLTRQAVKFFRPYLTRWDKRTTHRVDSFVGNSTFIQQRIDRYYQRPSRVIHPPVDTERFSSLNFQPDDYYLMVCGLVPYKNVDIAIEAFTKLDRKLVIAGDGPLYEKLQARCPKNVTMLGWVSDEQLPELVGKCRAFLMPNVEDFGIAPVEAQAAGRPVIALAEGGIRDTVVPYRPDAQVGPPATGYLYQHNTPESLAQAVREFEKVEHHFEPARLKQWADRFSYPRFQREVMQWLDDVMNPKQENREVGRAA